MAKKLNITKALILGSGALKIGEAGEFDYSGSQAVKALKEEGIKTVLINPNIATIQTSRKFTDIIYFLPLTPYFVEKIIKKEKPDGILLGFGGQTALNCGLTLAHTGVFKKYNVKVLGTPISAMDKTEDRLLFRSTIKSLGLKVPISIVCQNMHEVNKNIDKFQFPVIIRSGYSLGGLGSGIARNIADLQSISAKALALAPHILIEEYLEHWKEIEYEVVRDAYDNCVTVCNMENFDPMGIHTGESIVVAPSQTLTNSEYHLLREIAIKVVKNLPIIGECNIQYALNPQNGDYRIIELNARLSRSSALASKATGYPLAYIAAKLALGFSLTEIPNQVTKATCAFFEPALDYVVVKIPRWDFLKFRDKEEKLGSEMQSVGEVMAIGRSFEEAFQKATRSLDVDYQGLICDDLLNDSTVKHKKRVTYKSLDPTPSRPYNIAYNLFYHQSKYEIQAATGIDYWFLDRIQSIVSTYQKMLEKSKKGEKIDDITLKEAKKQGFSDIQIGKIYTEEASVIRKRRKSANIVPFICQIDTLAGEFPAQTNYLYLSYHRIEHDVDSGKENKQIAVLGSGPYQIGSSVEFDWCAVNSVLTARKLGYRTIMINCNPETVSTDYDISDKLYFEELTAERVLDIIEFEKCPLIVSVGGQIPNTLVSKLAKEKITFLGNSPQVIDTVENRQKFSSLLDELKIEQPVWKRLTNKKAAVAFANKIGYPVLIRPSYVLSGRAMFVAYSEKVFKEYLSQETAVINPEYPLVLSKFLRGAKEVDFDAVSQNGKIIIWALSEHVEHAGVHSGDATLVLPTFSLNSTTKIKVHDIAKAISKKLKISGPFNIQFLVNENEHDISEVLVIEANLRASRSFPFVSKITGTNFIELATRIMLGEKVDIIPHVDLPYVGVKVPHFSFTRLRRVDPVLRVEMTSTGEVACFGHNLYDAYLKALLSTGVILPKKAALLALGGEEGKSRLLLSAKTLSSMGFKIYATRSTFKFLNAYSLPAKFVYKVHEEKRPNVVDLIRQKKVDLVINLSERKDLKLKDMSDQVTDGYLIRRATVDSNIPLFTKATIANLFVSALKKYTLDDLSTDSWAQYLSKLKP